MRWWRRIRGTAAARPATVPRPEIPRVPGDPRRPANTVLRRARLRAESFRTPRAGSGRPRRVRLFYVPLAFASLIAVGTFLLVTPLANSADGWSSLLDALFTATSAVCVTGLTRVETAGNWSGFGEAVILTLIQLGGLGIIVSAAALLALAGRRVGMGEWLGYAGLIDSERSPLGFVIRVALLVLTIEAASAILLFAWFIDGESLGTAVWKSVFHAVSAFNNAGFDLQGPASFSGQRESAFLLVVLAGTSLAGSLSFWVLFAIPRLPWSVDLRLVLGGSVVLLIAGMVVFAAGETHAGQPLAGLGVGDTIANSFFLSTMGRTTGMTTVDFGAIRDITAVSALGFMFIGGVAGSTAGGVKVGTFMVLLVAMKSRLRGEPDAQIFARRIAAEIVDRALVVALSFGALLILGVWLLELTDDFAFLPTVFEAVSALGTVGWSAGITAHLSTGGALVVVVLMFTGRLAPLLLAAAASRRVPQRYRLVDTVVRIG